MPRTSRRCSYTRLDGQPCRAWAVRGSEPPACAAHATGQATATGRPGELLSQARPAEAGDGPVGHGPAAANPAVSGIHAGKLGIADFDSAAAGELMAAATDIAAVIADLAAKQECLSHYIDDCLAAGDTAVQDMARLLALHSQNASRLGRLLRDQKALGGAAANSLQHIIDLALDGLAEDWGIEL